MNPMEFVLIIIMMSCGFAIIKQKLDARDRRAEREPVESAENVRLKDEVRQLKERIQVLERITVEKENTLAKQIEELRDR